MNLLPDPKKEFVYFTNHQQKLKRFQGYYDCLLRKSLSPAKESLIQPILAVIYLLKVNNRNTRTRCEICSKLTIKILERHQWHRSGIFIVDFKNISHQVPVFVLLTLNM